MCAAVALRNCTFETGRLLVKDWHTVSSSDWRSRELADVVLAMLTERVTRSLPATWQSICTTGRAREWIEERDREGPTLLVVDKLTQRAVGLMFLFEMKAEGCADDRDVRLGYLLSEDSWGKGIASELVDGFVRWCREQGTISSIAGGVAPDNPASARVLDKNGFRLLGGGDALTQDERTYRLSLR